MEFKINWTTVFVGWAGTGMLSPWPDRWKEFPPLLSVDEITAYAENRLKTSDDELEEDLILRLILPEMHTEPRESIKSTLESLSKIHAEDASLELRKWRLVCLEQTLESLPPDPIGGLLALTEFWQGFGSPPDSPHEVQGAGGSIPESYYTDEHFRRVLDRHDSWVKEERKQLIANEEERGEFRGHHI